MGTGAFRSRGRVAGFGAIAALAAAAVAGCGAASSSAASGVGSPGPAATTGGPTDAAAAAGAVQLAAKTSASATSVSGTMSVQATVKAGASGSANSGDLSLSGLFAERIRPSLLARVSISALKTAGKPVPGGLSEILTPAALYLNAPALTRELHLSKPWLSISLAQLSQGTGIDLSQLLNSVTTNGPLAQSQLLAGATSVRKTGTASLDGVPVTEYTGTLDLGKGAAALSGSSKSQLQQAIKTAGLSTATFTVWIDGTHVTRKAVIHETGKTLSETITTTITGINQPVSITVPAAGQITPLPKGSTTGTS